MNAVSFNGPKGGHTITLPKSLSLTAAGTIRKHVEKHAVENCKSRKDSVTLQCQNTIGFGMKPEALRAIFIHIRQQIISDMSAVVSHSFLFRSLLCFGEPGNDSRFSVCKSQNTTAMKAISFEGPRGGHTITLPKSLSLTAAVLFAILTIAAIFLQSELFTYLCAGAAMAAVCAAIPAECDSKSDNF